MLKKRWNGRQLRSLSVKMKLSWSKMALKRWIDIDRLDYYYYYYKVLTLHIVIGYVTWSPSQMPVRCADTYKRISDIEFQAASRDIASCRCDVINTPWKVNDKTVWEKWQQHWLNNTNEFSFCSNDNRNMKDKIQNDKTQPCLPIWHEKRTPS